MTHPQARQAVAAFEAVERAKWRTEMAEARLSRSLMIVPDEDLDWYVRETDELAERLAEQYSQRPELRWKYQHEEALLRAVAQKAREQAEQD